MAHVHDEDHSTYYLDQLCTIGVCVALGGVAVMLWLTSYVFRPPPPKQAMLGLLLSAKFHLPVLLGGIALLVLAGVRFLTLWHSARRLRSARNHVHVQPNDHSHEHHHEHEERHMPQRHQGAQCCQHPHDHAHGADSGHGHEHVWAPLQYVVLLLPVVLYFLDFPNQGFLETKSVDVSGIEEGDTVADKGGAAIGLEFKELEHAAYNQLTRSYYEGRTGVLKGQLAHSNKENIFSLVRYKMTCCAADAIPLKVVIVSPVSVRDIPQNQWVRVEGQIQFRQRRGQQEYVPVLQVPSRDRITEIPPEPNIYLQ